MPNEKLEAMRSKVREVICEYLQESRDQKREWNDKYRVAWDMINGRVDWGHKEPDQSRIHLNKVGLALERFKAQIKQGIMSPDRWITVEVEKGAESEVLSDWEAKKLLERGLASADAKVPVSDCIGIGAVENRSTLKLSTKVHKLKGNKKVLKICLEPLYAEDFHLDPEGEGLYQIHEIYTDKRNLLAMASDKPDKKKPYRMDVVKELDIGFRADNAEEDKKEKKGEYEHFKRCDRRVPIVVHEFWGTILDKDGSIMEWDDGYGKKFPLENVLVTIANEEVIIRDPEPNPRLNGHAPFVTSQILRTPGSVWGRSLVMPGVEMNQAADELMSCMVDGALKATYNVNQVRAGALSKPEQVSGGLKYGKTYLVNDSLPPGAKAIESVRTGEVPAEAMQIFGQIERSGAENMMTNEINLSGSLPSKQVRATELVQSQGAVQGLFESITSDLEDIFVERLATQVFHEMIQNKALLSDDDLLYIFNGNEERAAQFKSMTAQQVFDEVGAGFRFRGKGMRDLAQNARKAQAVTNLFAAVAANPLIMEHIQKEYSIPRLFGILVRGNSIDDEEIKLSEREMQFEEQKQLIMEEQMRAAELQGQQGQQAEQGKNMSQQGPGSEMEPGSGAGELA